MLSVHVQTNISYFKTFGYMNLNWDLQMCIAEPNILFIT